MKEHIARWTHASIKDFIKKNWSGAPLLVEGEDDRKPDTPFFVELRIDGPVIKAHGTKGEYIGEVEINLTITVKKDEKYVHLIQDKIGLAYNILDQCMPIKKIGNALNTPDIDDGSFVTVLQLQPDTVVDISNFGQVDPVLRVQQASVEAHYRMQLTL